MLVTLFVRASNRALGYQLLDFDAPFGHPEDEATLTLTVRAPFLRFTGPFFIRRHADRSAQQYWSVDIKILPFPAAYPAPPDQLLQARCTVALHPVGMLEVPLTVEYDGYLMYDCLDPVIGMTRRTISPTLDPHERDRWTALAGGVMRAALKAAVVWTLLISMVLSAGLTLVMAILLAVTQAPQG